MVSLRTLALSAVAFAAPLVSALTTADIVDNIRTLTTKAQALQAPAQSITVINGPLIIIGQGPFPQLIVGFQDIITTATTVISMQSKTEQVTTAADATAIANAYREFLRVNQVLFNILIGKSGLFKTVPLIGDPVAATLRQVEAVYDTIGFQLAEIVEPTTQNDQITADHNSLSGTVRTAVDSYAGLSVSNKVRREFRA